MFKFQFMRVREPKALRVQPPATALDDVIRTEAASKQLLRPVYEAMWRYLFPIIGTFSTDDGALVRLDAKTKVASASDVDIPDLVRHLQFTADRHACRASHECLGWPRMPQSAGSDGSASDGSSRSGEGAAAKKRKVVDVRFDGERRREDAKAHGLLDQYGSPAELMKRYHDTADTGIDEQELLALSSSYRLGGSAAGAKALLVLIEDPARESSLVKTNAARFASYG